MCLITSTLTWEAEQKQYKMILMKVRHKMFRKEVTMIRELVNLITNKSHPNNGLSMHRLQLINQMQLQTSMISLFHQLIFFKEISLIWAWTSVQLNHLMSLFQVRICNNMIRFLVLTCWQSTWDHSNFIRGQISHKCMHQ